MRWAAFNQGSNGSGRGEDAANASGAIRQVFAVGVGLPR